MNRSIFLAAAALLALPACVVNSTEGSFEGSSEDAAFAEEAADSVETGESESALLVAATDAVGASMTAEEAATAAAGAVDQRFSPAGCAVAEVQGTTVLYTLTDCTGPFGVARIDGSVQVTFSVASDGLHATIAGSGVSARGATLELDADALYTESGTARTLTVNTAGTATGPRGRQVERSGSYTVSWDAAAQCASLDGAWSTEAGARTWSTEVSGLQRCADQCPAAGGRIEHTGGVQGVTITIEFDGSDTASWSSSRGQSGTIDLMCGG